MLCYKLHLMSRGHTERVRQPKHQNRISISNLSNLMASPIQSSRKTIKFRILRFATLAVRSQDRDDFWVLLGSLISDPIHVHHPRILGKSLGSYDILPPGMLTLICGLESGRGLELMTVVWIHGFDDQAAVSHDPWPMASSRQVIWQWQRARTWLRRA